MGKEILGKGLGVPRTDGDLRVFRVMVSENKI